MPVQTVLRRAPSLFAAALITGAPAWSQGGHLPEVSVRGPRDAAIRTADSASEGAAKRASFQTRPQLRPGVQA